jgi:hypothetical protein
MRSMDLYKVYKDAMKIVEERVQRYRNAETRHTIRNNKEMEILDVIEILSDRKNSDNTIAAPLTQDDINVIKEMIIEIANKA